MALYYECWVGFMVEGIQFCYTKWPKYNSWFTVKSDFGYFWYLARASMGNITVSKQDSPMIFKVFKTSFSEGKNNALQIAIKHIIILSNIKKNKTTCACYGQQKLSSDLW